MALNTQEQILIEQRVANEAKSTGAAYLLWFFLGGFAGHRFYLGRTGSAVAMLLLTLTGVITAVIGIGFVILLGVGIWILVDAFLIPGMVQQQKNDVRRQLTQDALIHQR
jgi:TM2 domain-containing membrane protein YozV